MFQRQRVDMLLAELTRKFPIPVPKPLPPPPPPPPPPASADTGTLNVISQFKFVFL